MFRRISAAVRKEICPYCFDQFKLNDTPFRCSSPPQRCAPERDQIRADKWDDSLPIGRVLPATSQYQESLRCSTCNQLSQKRICPHCHMDLPHTTGKFRNYIFAVIGAKEAGKSHFLAVLIEHIRKQIGPAMSMLLEPLDDHTITRYRTDFYEPIYHHGTVIRGTVSALADRKVQMPLVYSLTFSGKGLFGQHRIRSAITLVFFDTAGEDLDADDVMSAVNKYIYRSDGVVLLLDPLQLLKVRDRLESSSLPGINTETSDIITRTTKLILAGRGKSPDAMVKIPLAVAFSKFDAVEPLIDPQLQLNADSNHNGGFDCADFEAVNAEMQSLLQEWECQNILQQVETRYRRFGFFGLSALGCNPHGSNKIPKVFPHRIEDPFLWLLHQHGLIHAAKVS